MGSFQSMSGSVGKRVIAGKKADSPLRRIVHGESLDALATLAPELARLVYVDPPFNTGRTQARARLWYARDPRRYVFDHGAIDRVPYMAPRLVGPEKAARGKTPTDVWWNTIVPTNGREKTGYPTQKPLAILERIVRVHSEPGDVVLDFFAGSGTSGEAAARNGRGFVMIDSSRDAVRVMRERLAPWSPELVRVRAARRPR